MKTCTRHTFFSCTMVVREQEEEDKLTCAYSGAKASLTVPINLHTPVPEPRVSLASHIKTSYWLVLSRANYS